MDVLRLSAPDFVGRSTKCIHFRFFHAYKASFYAQQYTLSYQALTVSIRKTWGSREKSGLWWTTVAPAAICPKSTIRRHQLRRLRNAFREALEAKGMDKDGKPIEVIRNRHSDALPLIKGTVQLTMQPEIIQSEYSTLQEECGTIVDKLLQLTRKGPQPKKKRDPDKFGKREFTKGRTKIGPESNASKLQPLSSPFGGFLTAMVKTRSQQPIR